MIDPLPSDIFRQGQVLNNTYEIEGLLGRGGTGEVYRARNNITGRVVAIKGLSLQFSGNDDYIELVKREEQMRDIRDDAVVRYTECSRSDQGQVFLVMDFIDGPSMSDIIQTRRMDPKELLIVAHRVAEGLVAAHGKGIVHRDLSPDNVVLRGGSAEKATIIDFGIAKDTAAGARTIVGNEFAGKYEYAAPEQLDGKAEKRSDFYALGATLLACYRGQIPFSGSTPGEIVRRKQMALDSTGVPEPLKGLVDWLTAPDMANRPARAEDILARIDGYLRPITERRERSSAPRTVQPAKSGRTGSRLWLLLVPPVLGAALAAAWFAGLFDRFLVPPLPTASPYVLSAGVAEDGTATLSGNAPDQATAAMLSQAFAAVSGKTPAADVLTLAHGMPAPTWATDAAGLLAAVTGLADWRVEISDQTATVEGLAATRDGAKAVAAAIRGWIATSAITPTLSIAVGPRTLPAATVAAIAAPFASCGPLTQSKAAGESYGLGDTIALAGAFASARDGGALQAAMEAAAGDRKVRIDAIALNDVLCAVHRVLPPVPANGQSIWMGYGDTGKINPSGVFHVGDNPIVEVQLPESVADGYLWVVLINDTGGNVYNLLPNRAQEEHAIARIGTLADGIRRVRVIHSIADFKADPDKIAFSVTPTDVGRAEIIALVTKTPLFAVRRPRDESVASFAEALAEIAKNEPENILSIATRLLDSRP